MRLTSRPIRFMPLSQLLGCGLAALLATAIAPPPSAAAEREVTIGGLSATIREPSTPAAAGDRRIGVVIVAGSGPTDRDGGSPQGLDTAAYRLIASALADAGHVSVRYDKRGVARSAGAAPPAGERALTIETFADDAARVADHLRAEPGVGKVAFVGHSEGGLVALLAAGRARIDALVLLATPGRPLGRLLRAQLARQPLPPEVTAEAERVLTALEAGTDVGDVEPPLDQLFRASVLPFLRSVVSVDPVPLLAVRPEPVLIAGAGRDIQVRREDFDALARARGGLSTHWEDGATHTLKLARDNDPAQVLAYTDPRQPLAPGLMPAIIAFLAALGP